MKEKGFAVLRTPWPFRHRIGEEPAPEEPVGPRRRGEIEEEKIWEGEDLRELEEGGYAAAREDNEQGDEDEGRDEGESAGRWEMVDLTIPGAEGPETHVYGSTAIHLYMKKQAGPNA